MEVQLKLFINAVTVGDVVNIRRLVADGADVNVQGPKRGRPPHWAAGGGHADAVRVLVEVGAEVEASADNGARPLHVAAHVTGV
jgi:ankyrin repeat protein